MKKLALVFARSCCGLQAILRDQFASNGAGVRWIGVC